MKKLLLVYFLMSFISNLVQAKENRILGFTSKSVHLCGHSISWQTVVSGLTAKESDCLDSISPLDFSESEIIKSAQIIELTQERLVDLLKKSRSQCLSEVELIIPSRVTFSREKVLNQETVTPWIDEQFKNSFADKTHELIRFQVPKIDCEKTNVVKWGSFRIEGLNQFRMLVTADDKNFAVGGDFRLFQQLPVLVRPFLPNQRIEAKDLQLVKKDVTFNQSFISKIDDLVGRTLTFPLGAGEAVQYRQIKEEKMIEKGQIVQIQYKSESFVLSATGVAEQSGTIGDNVKIKNLESQKIFSAVVLGKGVVEVQ